MLLDLDDTLVDTYHASHRAFRETARHLGLPAPTPEAFRHAYGRLSFRECVDLWCGPGHFTAFAPLYRRTVRYSALGDVAGLLERIGRARLRAGLITNSPPDAAHRKLRAAGVAADQLELVATAADLPVAKPDVEAFRSTLRRHGIDPAEAVYVSDHPADGQGARAAGLAFRGVLTGPWTAEAFQEAGTGDADLFATVHDALRPLLAGIDAEQRRTWRA